MRRQPFDVGHPDLLVEDLSPLIVGPERLGPGDERCPLLGRLEHRLAGGPEALFVVNGPSDFPGDLGDGLPGEDARCDSAVDAAIKKLGLTDTLLPSATPTPQT